MPSVLSLPSVKVPCKRSAGMMRVSPGARVNQRKEGHARSWLQVKCGFVLAMSTSVMPCCCASLQLSVAHTLLPRIACASVAKVSRWNGAPLDCDMTVHAASPADGIEGGSLLSRLKLSWNCRWDTVASCCWEVGSVRKR
jgi:hypothetical protein